MPKGIYKHHRKDPAERLWAKVDQSGDCWLWTGGTNGKEYGRFWDGSKHVYAHRFAYELLVGPIPAGVELDHRHTCSKRCVRPDHLRFATHKQQQENLPGARVDNQHGVRGVTLLGARGRRKRWQARVNHNGRRITVGYYHTLEDAEAAVIAKRNELFTHNDVDRT